MSPGSLDWPMTTADQNLTNFEALSPRSLFWRLVLLKNSKNAQIVTLPFSGRKANSGLIKYMLAFLPGKGKVTICAFLEFFNKTSR
jgi:hypothetical protein